ncbi:hypothetical protein SCALM49S_05289 [Streptomyces californicus]
MLDPLLDSLVGRELAHIPVSRLKDVTEGRLRLGALEQAGCGTVGQVHGTDRYALRQLPGVGAHTADQALAAARQIAHAVRDTVSVRIDVDAPDDTSTALVTALHRLVEAGPGARRAVDAARRLTGLLEEPVESAAPAGSRLRMLLAGAGTRARVREALGAVRAAVADADERELPVLFAQASVDLLRGLSSDVAAWVDFELRSAEYYSLLAEISGRLPDAAAAAGFFCGRDRGAGTDPAPRRHAPAGLPARLPGIRRTFRACAAQGDTRRRDGPREDHPGDRRPRPPGSRGAESLHGRLPGERSRELDS